MNFGSFILNQQFLAADQGRCKEIAKVKTDPKFTTFAEVPA